MTLLGADAVQTDVSRRALVLAGGGMRVAYQAGVVRALEEHGLTFQLLDGASGGTLNLAMWLSGLDASAMCERWRTLNVQDFASLLSLEQYFSKGGFPGWGSADGIRDKVFPHLGIDVAKIRERADVQGTFNVCNYTDKINVAVPHQDVSLEQLLAGVSLPMFMPAVAYAGKLWVDSVWVQDANVTEVVRRGAQEVWLVWCIGNIDEYHPGTLEQYVHMIEISANASLFAELAWLRELNERIAQGLGSPYGQTRPIALHLIKPHFALPLDPEYFLGKIDAETLIGMGYADARRYLDAASGSGVELTSSATKMQAPPPGVAFRAHFDGELHANAPLAPSGAVRARFGVDIPHLAHFQEDSTRAAAVYGSLDIASLAEGMLIYDGQFTIDSVDSSKRRARYVGKFVAAGVRYTFSATQDLELTLTFIGPHAAPLQLEIQALAPAQGPASSGALTLDGGVLQLVKSIRTVGVQGVTDRVRWITEFATFIGGPACARLLRPRRPWWKFWARD